MRILLMANHFNTGGISSYLRTLARQLIGAGHGVWIVTSGGDVEPELESAGIRCVRMNLRMKSNLHPLLFGNLPRLLALLKNEQIDLMHAQTRVTAMLASMASRMNGIPYVTTCHGYFRPHLGRRLLPLWGQRVMAISRPVAQHLERDLGVAKDKIDLVPNGIDLEAFHPITMEERIDLRRQRGLGEGPIVGIIARLSDVKGHRFLIEAMRTVRQSFPGVRCLIFGDGPEGAALQEQVREAGLKQTVLFYPVTGNSPERVIGLFDVFVMPSVSEGLGLSVMEAMACGVPVVASAVGGLRDIVKDGVTGYAIPARDPAAIAQAVMRLLVDPERAGSMAECARRFMCENFSSAQMLDGTLKTYRRVLEGVRPEHGGA